MSEIKEEHKNTKLKVIKTNLKFFGVRYLLWDCLYQTFSKFHSLLYEEKNLPRKDVVKLVNNYRMVLNKNGKGIHKDLVRYGEREVTSTGIMKEWIKEGDVVLDLGANIGYYTVLASKNVGKKGKVYAIEPAKDNFEYLTKNIKLNHLKNVETHQVAVGDKDGELKIYISDAGNYNTPVQRFGEDAKFEMVKCFTLDTFFKDKPKPTILKMDIEGYECEVFKGSKETLKHLEKIFVELHFSIIDHRKMIKTLTLLKESGFEISQMVLEWKRTIGDNTFTGNMADWLYKKRNKIYIYKNIKIDDLVRNLDILDSHLSYEVFFEKK